MDEGVVGRQKATVASVEDGVEVCIFEREIPQLDLFQFCPDNTETILKDSGSQTRISVARDC